MDKDGYVMISGRIKDMIIRGGENIYPAEVEQFLYGLEAIEDVQIIGKTSSCSPRSPYSTVYYEINDLMLDWDA